MRDLEPAAVLHGPFDIRVEQRPVDPVMEHEVMVAVSAVGICGSDVHYFEHGSLGPNVIRAPHVLGHEFCGRVVARGAGVQELGVGDRVSVEPGVPCGACPECTSGRYNLCAGIRFLGVPPVDGALRPHVSVSEQFATPLPGSISDEAGALIEPLAVGVWACRRGSVGAGDRVLITGAGPIGLLTAQVAAARGAAEVAVIDPVDARLERAAGLGASVVLRPNQVHGRAAADILIECSGSVSALGSGVAAVRPGGTVVLVGMSNDRDVRIPFDDLQRRELTVHGSFRYAGCFPEAIELVAGGRVQVEPLVTARYPLADVRSALRAVREDPQHVKAVVIPG